MKRLVIEEVASSGSHKIYVDEFGKEIESIGESTIYDLPIAIFQININVYGILSLIKNINYIKRFFAPNTYQLYRM